MIDLYTWATPNGRKISILLEEINTPYSVHPVNIIENEQFSDKFSRIAPSNKIPAIIDRENGQSIFESGAIMMYLAKKHDQFLSQKHYWQIMEWVIFQLSQVGPVLGQAHQFLYYHPNQNAFVEKKYIDYTKRIYQTLNERLKDNEYLGVEYSIADIATWPWIARFERHRINISDYPEVLNWYKLIRERPAVIKGYNVVGKKEDIPI
jgi:GST-like protein